MAIDFNSGANQYCDGAVTGLTADTIGTVAVWCRPETLHDGCLFWIGDTGAGDHWVRMYLTVGGKATMDCITVGWDWEYTIDDVFWAAGDLLHIAMTQNGAAPRFFVNGLNVAITLNAAASSS
ncbi:unnamed protein product, partial [marine sediment metagenome]